MTTLFGCWADCTELIMLRSVDESLLLRTGNLEVDGVEIEEDIIGSLLEDTIRSLLRDELSVCVGAFGGWLTRIGIRVVRAGGASTASQFSWQSFFLSGLDVMPVTGDTEFCLIELLIRMLSFLGLIGSSLSSLKSFSSNSNLKKKNW